MGPFLKKISRQALIAQKHGARFQFLTLDVQTPQRQLLFGKQFAPLPSQQQSTISGQRMEAEIEDQERQGGGGDIGLETGKHGRCESLIGMVELARSLPPSA